MILGVGVVVCNIFAFAALLLWPAPLPVEVSREQVAPEVLEESAIEPNTSALPDSSVTVRTDPDREGTKTVPAEVDRVLVPVYTACSVLDAMREEERVGNLTFVGKEYPGLGLFVEEIQGVRPPDGKYWILYINGSPASRGAAEAMVTPKDLVEWKLEDSIY